MIHLLIPLTIYASITIAEFKSNDGSKCAFVFDVRDDYTSAYPLEECITDYSANSPYHDYQSREYICTIGPDNSVDIQVYTYWNNSCDGIPNEEQSALGDEYSIQPNAYQCGDGTSAYTDCFLEYKEYETISDTCEGWEASSYKTKYIIVGTCVAVDGVNTYSQCDTEASDEYGAVKYVKFNDDMCCDLSFQYSSEDSPEWKSFQIKTGCDNQMYIDSDSWDCNLPDGANDDDVFTDNTNEECTDIGYMVGINGIVYGIIGFYCLYVLLN